VHKNSTPSWRSPSAWSSTSSSAPSSPITPKTNTYGWYGTLASFGFIIVYLLCSIAAPVLLKRTGS